MEVVATRRVYEGRVVSLRVDTVRHEGAEHAAEVVEHAGAVVVIVRPEPGALTLVRQYRYPLGRSTLECVAGGIDPGETPEVAAARELREETGFTAGRLRRLFSAYTAPGFCTELLHFFEATELRAGPADNQGEEEITLETVGIEELAARIFRDELPDAKTQIAVLWARNEPISS